ncbi:MAG: hypothetical protein JOZ07_17875 [Solirubrobacterales bacterium]|nr:hypothetical protein [Solirubrobacterales bacterium]
MPAVAMHLPIASLHPDRGERSGYLLLIGLLGSFLFIRMSTRLIRRQVRWWPGNIQTSGGLHLHHLVFGIVLMMVTGFLAFVLTPGSPQTEILACLFGIGVGLTLDEFALWIHLRDVYWTEEGRASVRAVIVAVVIGGLLILTITSDTALGQTLAVTSLTTAVAIALIFSGAAILKGKPMLALIGVVFAPVALVACLRLASPRSLWARRFYAPDGLKMARAVRRWERIDARRLRLSDLIAGAPSLPDPGPADPGADERP